MLDGPPSCGGLRDFGQHEDQLLLGDLLARQRPILDHALLGVAEHLVVAGHGGPDRTPGDAVTGLVRHESGPHNGNLSNGEMFAEFTLYDRKPLDKAYVTARERWERLYEATQIKGDGEAHPFMSPDDEFADYETWDLGNLDSSFAKTNEMLDNESVSHKYRSKMHTHPSWTKPRKFES